MWKSEKYKLDWTAGDDRRREDEGMRVGMMSRVNGEEGGWTDEGGRGQVENLRGGAPGFTVYAPQSKLTK